MIDTLNIGKYIHSVLADASSGINAKDYPLVADNDAKYPFIVYRRIDLNSATCKDGVYQDDVRIEIIVVTDKYYVGIDIATRIRKLLEKQQVVFNDMVINDGHLMMATEEYSNNAYVQRLNFNFKIDNYTN